MTLHRALPLLLAFTATAFAAERTFDRTLTTGSAPNVAVAGNSGNIHIHAGNDSSVHIAGHVRSSSGWTFNSHGADADRVKQVADNPPIQQNGNDLQIGEPHGSDLFRNISIDYEITVPRNAVVDASTGSGDIEIQDVAQRLRADTGSGNVRAIAVHGPANLHTGSGNIELQQAAQADAKLDTGSGNIHAGGINAGLRAQSGSGDIEIQGKPATDWRLTTGSGAIRLALPQDARFNLDANTGSGDIQVRQPLSMQGAMNHHHVGGTVNGGGPNLNITTGSGDIEIK